MSLAYWYFGAGKWTVRLPLQMKKHIVQRQDLCTPAKVIKKNNLGGFSANPSKIAGCRITYLL